MAARAGSAWGCDTAVPPLPSVLEASSRYDAIIMGAIKSHCKRLW